MDRKAIDCMAQHIKTFHAQEKLKEYAQKQGLTRNALILKILWDWTEERSKNKSEDKENGY